MKKTITFGIIIMLFAGTAMANTVINTYPSWNNITNGYAATAQTFTVPTDNVLLSYMFGIYPRNVDGDIEFSIYNWVGDSQVGPALYNVTVSWTTATTDIDIQGINLTLSTGGLYGAVIDLKGYTHYSVYFISPDPYSGGHAYWGDSTLPWDYSISADHLFRAEFTGAPVPEPATLLLLGSGLIGVAGYGRKKFFKK